jgi:ATP-dependent RNA helicase RhlE
MQFTDLGVHDIIIKSLQEKGYSEATPIQQEAIPILLQGYDLLGCAQTGTGKTAAFAIPIIQHLYSAQQHEGKKRVLTTLVLTPTRELAIQIAESFKDYGKHTGLKHTVIFGGVSQHSQVQALQDTVNILIATPGRLLDLIQQGYINLSHIKFFVLDEADRMLDMGFSHDVKRIVKLLPPKRQNLFFSATMPDEIVALSNTILHEPKKVEITPVSSTAEKVEQYLYFIDKGNKRKLLLDLILHNEMHSVLVFTRTKHGADRVTRDLAKHNIKAAAIHGDKSQNARQRALSDFKAGVVKVLIATDIAARGIDIDHLSHVINYEIPNIAETYVHRIGRTGRAGAEGIALSFCDAEEQAYLKDIEKLIRQKIPVIEEHPYPMIDLNPVKAEKPQNKPRPKNTGFAANKQRGYGGNR